MRDCNTLIPHRIVVNRKSAYWSQGPVHAEDSNNVTTAVTIYIAITVTISYSRPFSCSPPPSTASAICTNSDLHLFSPGLFYQPPDWSSSLAQSPPVHSSSPGSTGFLWKHTCDHTSPLLTTLTSFLSLTPVSLNRSVWSTKPVLVLVQTSGLCFISY